MPDTPSIAEALARVSAYLAEYDKFKGVHPEEIHGLNHEILRKSDLRALIEAVRAVTPRPIEEAPRHEELLLYREDCGWVIGQHTCLAEFMTDSEVENSELSEDDLHDDDWWCYSQDGLERLSNGGNPTHFIPLDALPLPDGDTHE